MIMTKSVSASSPQNQNNRIRENNKKSDLDKPCLASTSQTQARSATVTDVNYSAPRAAPGEAEVINHDRVVVPNGIEAITSD